MKIELRFLAENEADINFLKTFESFLRELTFEIKLGAE